MKTLLRILVMGLVVGALNLQAAPAQAEAKTPELKVESFGVVQRRARMAVPTQAEAKTPELKVESFGVVQRGARMGATAFSPGTDEYPPRLMIGLRSGDGSWIVDLAGGTFRKVVAPGMDKAFIGWPSATGADGKVFMAGSKYGYLVVYNPATDSFKTFQPIPGARWLRGICVGADGGVYVTDYPTHHAARYDPVTDEIIDYGTQGGPFDKKAIYGYSIGAEGDWVYTAAGKIPWYVVAYNRKTGTQSNILTYTPNDHPAIRQRGKEVYLRVKLAGRKDFKYYRLTGGAAEPVEGIPDPDSSTIPGMDRPQPEYIYPGRNMKITQKGALLQYKAAGSDDVREVFLPVKGVPLSVTRLTALADGRVALATGGYGDVFLFDPATAKYQRLGSPSNKNVYALTEANGDIYYCGYANGMFGVFRGAKPGHTHLGNFHDVIMSKHAMHMVLGADGKLYTGNHVEREGVGGALAWYDPETKTFGGSRYWNSDCEWLTTAMDGRYIVYASDCSVDHSNLEATPPFGSLFVYDTQVEGPRKLVQKFSPLRDNSAGVCTEVRPGVVLGLGFHHGEPTAYLADVTAGKVLKRAPLPAPAIRALAQGPDGKVYFFTKEKTLVRIDGETLTVESLGQAAPGRLAFVGPDLYLGGEAALRRIKALAE